MGEAGRANENLRKAFALAGRTSERERLYLTSNYYRPVTGEVDKAVETLEMFKRTYPRDAAPRIDLSVLNRATGQFEKALEEAQESLRIDPGDVLGYVNAAWSFFQLACYEEAKAIAERALALKFDAVSFHQILFRVGALAMCGDAAQAQALAEETAKRFPTDTISNAVGIPLLTSGHTPRSPTSAARPTSRRSQAARPRPNSGRSWITGALRGQCCILWRMWAWRGPQRSRGIRPGAERRIRIFSLCGRTPIRASRSWRRRGESTRSWRPRHDDDGLE